MSQVARLDLNHIWATAIPLDPEANLWQPAPAAMLLHLCLHTGLQHRFNDLGLRHYLDIDRVVRHYQGQPDFWPAFVRLAQGTHAVQVAYFSLWFTEALLGTPMPVALLHQLAPAAWKRALFGRYLRPSDVVNRTRALYGGRRIVWRLLTTDRLLDLLRGPWRVLFPGRTYLADYYQVKNPASLLLLWAWHPLRSLGRAGRRRLREMRLRATD